MGWEEAFNVLLALAMVGFGWALRIFYNGIRDLRQEDQRLAERIMNMQTQMASHYVHKEDWRAFAESLRDQLNRIEKKIDSKADKGGR